MGHFDHHLARSTNEQVNKGFGETIATSLSLSLLPPPVHPLPPPCADPHISPPPSPRLNRGGKLAGIPDHLHSGFDRPDRRTGRQAPPKNQAKYDPKDGGVWEPVKREYPKVARVEHATGCKIVDKPKRETRPVDIWPDTITVRDTFAPGGVKIFPGKRATNTSAFPGALGYAPPDPKIDYSSVQHGGPFGYKLVHNNERVYVGDGATFRVDRTARQREASPVVSHHQSAPPTPLGEIAKIPPAPMPASRGSSRGLYGDGRRGTPAHHAAEEVLRPYTIVKKGEYEQGLKPASNWTFLNSYRP